MNCLKFLEHLDEFLAGELAASATAEAGEHLRTCASCQQRLARLQSLRALLRSQPVPAPRPGFFKHALRQARLSTRNHRTLWPRLVGAAVAATLAVWIGFGWLPSSSPAPGVGKSGGVTIALHETHMVQLALNSEKALSGATLRIRLPKGLELRGFPGQHEIYWRTDLAQGVNMLSLPLTALATMEGSLTARLEHNGRTTEFAVNVHVHAPV